MEARALASLQAIEGVSHEAAQELFKQGWRSAREVARANPEELQGLPGITDADTAQRVIAGAGRAAEGEDRRRQEELDRVAAEASASPESSSSEEAAPPPVAEGRA
jgi:hypothetical protein